MIQSASPQPAWLSTVVWRRSDFDVGGAYLGEPDEAMRGQMYVDPLFGFTARRRPPSIGDAGEILSRPPAVALVVVELLMWSAKTTFYSFLA